MTARGLYTLLFGVIMLLTALSVGSQGAFLLGYKAGEDCRKVLYEDILPYFCEKKIGAYQWGMIQGRTQTNLSWATMKGGNPEPNPALWQHDILYPDGTPYRAEETALIAKLGKQK